MVNGYPAITVIVDGGWSKRSHKHSYNAKSGVAIIIGKQTNSTWGYETNFVPYALLLATRVYLPSNIPVSKIGQDPLVQWKLTF